VPIHGAGRGFRPNRRSRAPGLAIRPPEALIIGAGNGARRRFGMKKTVTWVLVADGRRASIYRNDGPGRGLEAIPGHRYETELHADRELRTDKPGRSFESADGSRHAMSPPTDYHRQEKERFAERIAGKIETAALKGEFDRLVVVAEPKALGVLRGALGAHAKAKLVGEVDKDLTEQPVDQIAKRLGDMLRV
jgi:protein required for attachment to host cells